MAATILAYQPVWHAGFIWDDDVYVTNNPLLTAPDGWRRIWFSLDSPSQYFPLTYTVFRIQHAFWGLMPAGYHWVNILLHTVNALLVWRLLQRLTVPGAWLAAAIFALHPVQVESVAWVTELKSILSLFFILLALLTWLEFIEEESKPSWRWYLLALICQALALFSKTTACTLPAALLLILWFKHKPINWVRLAQIVPFLAMGLGMGLLTVWWERYHQGTQGKMFALGLPERLLVAGHAFWFYFGKLIWPVNLTFSYPRWVINPADTLAYGWLVAGVGLGAAIYWSRRFVGRGPEVALLFYGAMLSPLLGFIMLYTFLFTFVADHYQYVACIGPIALATAGISKAFVIWGKRKPILKPVFCGMLLLTLVVLTWRQGRMYADAETLWRTTIARNPACWLAYGNLGDVLLQKGRVDEAVTQLQRAISIQPDYAAVQNDFGTALVQMGKLNEAVVHYQKALEIKPDFALARYNLGNALLQKGQTDEAVIHFQKALEIQPDFALAQYNLGNVLLQKGRVDAAIVHFQRALAIQPDYADAHVNLGNALLQKGQTEEAIVHFQQALAIKPDDAAANNNLGNALLQKGQTDQAIVHFQKALAVRPDDAATHYNLGNALLQKGLTDEAIIHFQRALAIQPDYAKAHNNLGAAFVRKGQLDEAIVHFQKALAIQPGFVEARDSLTGIAWLLATSPDPSIRNGTKAVELARQTDQLSDGKNPATTAALAAAYAETGRFPEAIITVQRALQLAVSQNNTALISSLEAQLKSYQAGSPFRDTTSR